MENNTDGKLSCSKQKQSHVQPVGSKAGINVHVVSNEKPTIALLSE